MTEKQPGKKANRAVIIVLVVFSVLVGTNLGEFWPFSIYPMFSSGGNPWSRALVREVPTNGTVSWETATLDDLPGDPVSVAAYGVDPIDLANFVSKTEEWTDSRVDALENMFFKSDAPDARLLVFRVNGRLTERDEVLVEAVPYVLVGTGENLRNPEIEP